MLITVGKLSPLHYGGGWGRGPGPARRPGSAQSPHSRLLGPNWTLGVWSCTALLQEIIFPQLGD